MRTVDAAEEIRRTVDLVAAIRAAHPALPISIDTWRASVAREALAAGADVVNDAWGGVDPELAGVAAEAGAGLVCTHAGGLPPRTRPHRVRYDDVVADIVARTTALADAAVAAGVDRDRVLVDPGHDFGKNTRHSLEATRRLGELVDTGWPVLVALSNKDFVGETLDVPLDERLTGTLAATAVSAWLGARVFRAHDVAADPADPRHGGLDPRRPAPHPHRPRPGLTPPSSLMIRSPDRDGSWLTVDAEPGPRW